MDAPEVRVLALNSPENQARPARHHLSSVKWRQETFVKGPHPALLEARKVRVHCQFRTCRRWSTKLSEPPVTVLDMNAIALLETDLVAPLGPASDPETGWQLEACRDCAKPLGDAELLLSGDEYRCTDCADLAAHNGECRDCGRLLADADFVAGSCADCLA